MNGRPRELPARLAAKYASELEEVRNSKFWNTPMTKEKLSPLTDQEWKTAFKAALEAHTKKLRRN